MHQRRLFEIGQAHDAIEPTCAEKIGDKHVIKFLCVCDALSFKFFVGATLNLLATLKKPENGVVEGIDTYTMCRRFHSVLGLFLCVVVVQNFIQAQVHNAAILFKRVCFRGSEE